MLEVYENWSYERPLSNACFNCKYSDLCLKSAKSLINPKQKDLITHVGKGHHVAWNKTLKAISIFPKIETVTIHSAVSLWQTKNFLRVIVNIRCWHLCLPSRFPLFERKFLHENGNSGTWLPDYNCTTLSKKIFAGNDTKLTKNKS